jgi:hypothetical protein
VSLGALDEGISVEEFPMIEHTLWEGTSRGGGTESLGETERLGDWKVGLHVDEWGSGDWLFSDNDTSTLGEALVDSTNGVIWALNLDEEDWLDESGCRGELASVGDTSSGWDDLTTTSVNSIGVEGNIVDVESESSEVLLSHDSLSGGPLEGGFDGILDFLEVLDGLGHIDEEVGSGGVWSEAPNLLGMVLLPVEVVAEDLSSGLEVLLGVDGVVLNGGSELVTEWLGGAVESVMLVW